MGVHWKIWYLKNKIFFNQIDKTHVGHVSTEDMEYLIRNAKFLEPELCVLIKDVVNSCITISKNQALNPL